MQIPTLHTVDLSSFNQGDTFQITSQYNESSTDVFQIVKRGSQPMASVRQLGGMMVLGEPVLLLGSISKDAFLERLANNQKETDYLPGALKNGLRYVMQCGAYLMLSDISVGTVEHLGRSKVSTKMKNYPRPPVLHGWTIHCLSPTRQ